MKKVATVLFALIIGFSAFSQDTTQVKQKVNISPYVATGLSIGTSNDFTAASYVSVEAGVMIENLMVGFVFGVNDLNSFGNIQNYWYEGKVAYAIPANIIDIYGVIGIGSYTGQTDYVFFEYGGGISRSFNNGLGVFLQATSWDGLIYVTPGLFYSF